MSNRAGGGSRTGGKAQDCAREKKWEERGNKFFGAFLFVTRDGRPKSSLMIYTFCLSFVFLLLILGSLFVLIDMTEAVTSHMPAIVGNLLLSLGAGALSIAVGCLLHRLLKDKRLVYGSYLWLLLYLVAILITEYLMLRGEPGAFADFLVFYLWFAVIPVLSGCLVFYRLCKRDYVAPTEPPRTLAQELIKKYSGR